MARTRDVAAQARILEAVREMTGEWGPGMTTMTEFADGAMVGRQTMYRWWDTRADLLLEALTESVERSWTPPDTGDVHDDLRTHLVSIVEAFRGPDGQLVRELIASAQLDLDISDQFRRQFFLKRRRELIRYLDDCIEHQLIDHRTDSAAVAAALHGPLFMALLIGHEVPTVRLAERTLDLVWPSLTPT